MGIKTKYKNIIANKVKQSYILKLKTNRLLLHSCLIHRNNKLKKFVFLVTALFSISSFSQETKYKEYSFAQLYQMIEDEKDTIFKLKNAIIRYNAKTDSVLTVAKYGFMNIELRDTTQQKIIVDKQIEFNNVIFGRIKNYMLDQNDPVNTLYNGGYIMNVHFKKKVRFTDVMGLVLHHCVFDDEFRLSNNRTIRNLTDQFIRDKKLSLALEMGHNTFHNRFNIYIRDNLGSNMYSGLLFFKNTIHSKYKGGSFTSNGAISNRITMDDVQSILIFENQFLGDGLNTISLNKTEDISISNNTFMSPRFSIGLNGGHDNLVVKDNKFVNGLRLTTNDLQSSDLIDWNQFNNKIYSLNAFNNYTSLLPDKEYDKIFTDSFATVYKEKLRFQNPEVYSGEAAMRGILYRHYRDNFDMVSANKVYMNLKDFETKHLEYQFESNPSFDTYFQWKVNQFLKVFSNYGTKPSKAITFSVYVIFFFGLIYLFFPNSWDSHGKNRILDRYRFFLKYMSKKAGIHEVYLADQKEELLAYEEYKKLIDKSHKKVPKFFTTTALPLYKWSISGTRFSAAVLRRIDIIRGSWQELPKKKRFWKTALLIGAFIIALIYDLFIKVLNALMLSINTFTTLGFGEIPIKGLPRYLAIIQGFIGWFMLTIFSVSLISQLLN